MITRIGRSRKLKPTRRPQPNPDEPVEAAQSNKRRYQPSQWSTAMG